ncbi:MAG: lasso peptide biosynthesis B2 protein [Vicinamibacterales bacterium]
MLDDATRRTRFRSLPPRERRLATQGAILWSTTRLALRVVGFKRCSAALQWLTPRKDQIAAEWAAEDEATRVERAQRLLELLIDWKPGTDDCLPRSLLLRWLLRQQGVESELRIGARKVHGEMQAHAWIEYQGRPLNEDDNVHDRYAAFDQHPEAW